MLGKLFFISFLCLAAADSIQLFNHLTPEEAKSIFGTTKVPEHEVVPVAIANRHKRAIGRNPSIVQLNTFEMDIRLYLEPNEDQLVGDKTPVWLALSNSSSPEGVGYKRLENVMSKNRHIYQDEVNGAAITVDLDENGKELMYGTIGDNLVIHPLPERFRENYTRTKRSLEEELASSNRTIHPRNFRDTYHHIVFKRNAPSINATKHIKIREESFQKLSPLHSALHGRSKREIPDTVYPEVLVILDYNEFSSFPTVQEAILYVISFWNAVDLRFRVFSKPTIRLNIAGIIIPGDEDAIPYVSKNHIKVKQNFGTLGKMQLNADGTLKDMADYFYQESMTPELKRFVIEKHYDFAVLMTKLKMCTQESDETDNFSCETLGYTYRNGACTVKPKGKEVEAVAIVEDDAGFKGLIPAAHEVGHLMGAYHDGHKTAEDCSPHEGYIMTTQLMLNKNTFLWSWCSINSIHDFFKSERSTCTHNKPDVGVNIKRILPGIIMDVHGQCDRLKGSHSCNPNQENVCQRLQCFDKESRTCVGISPAAEGSACGKNKRCINGQCIRETARKVKLHEPIQPRSDNRVQELPQTAQYPSQNGYYPNWNGFPYWG